MPRCHRICVPSVIDTPHTPSLPHMRVRFPYARQVQKVGESYLPCISLALQWRGGLMGGGGGRRRVVQALVGSGTPIT